MAQDPSASDRSARGLPPPGDTAYGRTPLLWFGFLGGAAAWFVYHMLGYGLVEVRCHSSLFSFDVLGVDGAVFVGLALGVVAAAVALAACLAAWTSGPRGLQPDTAEPNAPEAHGRTRFMSFVGTLLSALFLLAILSSAAAYLFVRPC